MTYYPPTTLPPSLPYVDLDAIIIAVCDRCLIVTDSEHFPPAYKQQFFDLTMSLIDFWECELEDVPCAEL